jgi:cobalt-zinc-cadmium efflux system membrane fusion protein
MLSRILILAITLILPWSVSNALAQDNHNHDEETAHQNETKNADDVHDESPSEDHEADNEHGDDCDNEGHEEDKRNADVQETELIDNHEGHDHEAEKADEFTIQLTSEASELAGIKISKVKHSRIGKSLELPGEIGFNEDRLVHIAPRFAGIALKANYKVGDYVKKDAIVAVIESNESMNFYSIKSPISGWVIERHISSGEYVSEENSIFVVADLSTVWVNLAVYPKDAARITTGQIARIHAVGTKQSVEGKIQFVSPIIDFKTRNAIARIILPNPGNIWRPGTFVQAEISTDSGKESLVVEKEAVQFLDEDTIVFVVDGPDNYKPVEIVTGDSNTNYVQVLSGVEVDTEYVSSGAFELKAKIVTSNLDPHAGHGH